MTIGGSLESKVAFFSEDLCDRGDDALRFAFILTLSRPSAHECVKVAFRSLADSISELDSSINISETVVKECWKSFQSLEIGSPTKNDVSDALGKLDIKVRAAVGAVDYMGLTPASAMKILGVTNDELRHSLAMGRKSLFSSVFAK